jgi:spore coat polysaccharide biosynthesis predicted glycosyltransferase SpsG
MKLCFRTRGGPIQGWGNIYRLASFADYCRERLDAAVVFVVEGPPEVHRFLEERDFSVVALPEDLSVAEEGQAWAAQGPIDAIIMEMLEVTYARQEMLREHAEQVVVFDDLCDHRYCADLVVCGQALPSTANRDLSADHTRFLVGPDYFLCRPEFLAHKTESRAHTPEISRVLVTLGGGRYDVGFEKAARALVPFSKQLDEAVFVLGPANLERLGPRISALLPMATVLGGVHDMPQRLMDCDLAIVSAGYSKLEAALLGTPAIMISAQWHQIPLAACFAPRSGIPDLGYMSYVSVADLQQAIAALQPQEAREAQARQAQTAVDGHGFARVFRAIFEAPEVSPE